MGFYKKKPDKKLNQTLVEKFNFVKDEYERVMRNETFWSNFGNNIEMPYKVSEIDDPNWVYDERMTLDGILKSYDEQDK